MKLISWNVNGLRAVLQKNFLQYVQVENPDVLCLQETKLQEDQVPAEFMSLGKVYNIYWNFAQRRGYSGVCLLCKQSPRRVSYKMNESSFDIEGRTVIADFDDFTLINCYFPNGQMSDERLRYKLDFYDRMFQIMEETRSRQRNIIVAGDFNTAHKEIDLANPRENENTSGFLPVERAWLDKLIDNGYTDTFRHFDKRGDQYSWWTYRFGARQRNIGWRIDYFFVNNEFLPRVNRAFIQQNVLGSDHCPVGVEVRENGEN